MASEDDIQESVLQDQPDEISEEESQLDDELDDDDEQQTIQRGDAHGSRLRKLTTLIAVFAILIGFILSTYQATQKPKVIYANRYSKEHQFRPAASPIITETLKDGRVRIRGAEPTMSSSPPNRSAKSKPKRKRKTAKKKAASNKKKAKAS